MRRLLFLTALLVLGPTVPAVAGPPPAAGHEFAGRCVGSGLISLSKPMSAVPSLIAIDFVSSGTCTGTVDGVPVREARYVGHTGSPGAVLSCEGGAVMGGGELTFPDLPGRPSISVRFSALNVTDLSGFTLRGVDGGLGIGQHQLTPDVALISACLTSGVEEIGNTISIGTLTPLRG